MSATGKFMVISEKPTHPSKPQEYVSETRTIQSAISARDWRDLKEHTYRKKGDNREVLLVLIMDEAAQREAITKEKNS